MVKKILGLGGLLLLKRLLARQAGARFGYGGGSDRAVFF